MSAVHIDIQYGSTCATCTPFLTLLERSSPASSSNGSPLLQQEREFALGQLQRARLVGHDASSDLREVTGVELIGREQRHALEEIRYGEAIEYIDLAASLASQIRRGD
jgi:hypothetical protein